MSLRMKKLIICLSVILPGAVSAGLVIEDEPAQKKPAAPLIQPLLIEVLAAKTPASLPIQPVWIKKPSDSLRTVINDWSVRSGWQVEWNVKDEETQEDKDFRLGGGLRYEGSYKEAIVKLFDSLPASIKVRAEFVSENVPPMLYVIKGEAQ